MYLEGRSEREGAMVQVICCECSLKAAAPRREPVGIGYSWGLPVGWTWRGSDDSWKPCCDGCSRVAPAA